MPLHADDERQGCVFDGLDDAVVETQPELLAHHYTEAGATDRALLYWRKAGERASTRLAFVEALGHVEAAMKMIDR